jgi:hypothetical protein
MNIFLIFVSSSIFWVIDISVTKLKRSLYFYLQGKHHLLHINDILITENPPHEFCLAR